MAARHDFETRGGEQPIDISRLSEGVLLSQEVSSEIQGGVLETSAFQSLARKVDMPATGITYQMITGEPEAGWVGETEEKPVSRPTFGTDSWQPYKMAVIVPFSDEFRRDAGRLFAEVQRRIPAALGRLFDCTVLGQVGAPGEHFDQLDDVTEVLYDGSTVDTAYDSILDVDQEVSDNGYNLDGWALSTRARNRLLRVRDGATPLFANDVRDGAVYTTLLGGRVEYRKVLNEVPGLMGLAGDFSAAEWGAVTGVRLSASDQATLTDTDGSVLNLWQRNMFALRAEIEVAFRADKEAFARLIDADAPAGGGGGTPPVGGGDEE